MMKNNEERIWHFAAGFNGEGYIIANADSEIAVFNRNGQLNKGYGMRQSGA